MPSVSLEYSECEVIIRYYAFQLAVEVFVGPFGHGCIGTEPLFSWNQLPNPKGRHMVESCHDSLKNDKREGKGLQSKELGVDMKMERLPPHI